MWGTQITDEARWHFWFMGSDSGGDVVEKVKGGRNDQCLGAMLDARPSIFLTNVPMGKSTKKVNGYVS